MHQLNSAVDSSALGQLAKSRVSVSNSTTTGGIPYQPYQSTGGTGNKSTLANGPFFGRGAVGYQPVIMWLPEGANLMAQAVISADRRYVRVTSMPLFSGIGQVKTFNYATGASGTTTGGTGGQGFSGIGGGGGGGFGICFGGTFANIEDAPGALFPYRGEQGAVVVATTQPGSPGEKAGFCPGDIIYSYEGEMFPVGNTIDLLREKIIPIKLKGNETRTIGVLRDGVRLELRVTWPEWKWALPPAGDMHDLPDPRNRAA
jgi:hypothetical protein